MMELGDITVQTVSPQTVFVYEEFCKGKRNCLLQRSSLDD